LPLFVLAVAALVSAVLPGERGGDLGVIHDLVEGALAALLFAGGRRIGYAEVRRNLAAVLRLGLVGTGVMVLAIATVGHLGLGWGPTLALAAAAALAPTDPAATFQLFGRERGSMAVVLQAEAVANDPVAIAVLASLHGLSSSGASGVLGLRLVVDVLYQLLMGTGVGAVIGRSLRSYAIARRRPGLVAIVAGAVFLLVQFVGGSGFVAVFLVGAFNFRGPDKSDERRLDLEWLAETVAFATLGTVLPLVRLDPGTILQGVVLLLVGVLGSRVVMVVAVLVRTPFSLRQRVTMGVAGARGAVSLFLALALIGMGDSGAAAFSAVVVACLASLGVLSMARLVS
jgi:NhaP-type Na+/H+ or K+/H+ antiporter